MTADRYEQPQRPLGTHVRETSAQLGGRADLAGSLARVQDSPTTQAVAPG